MAIPTSKPRVLDPAPFDAWVITQIHVWGGGCAPFGLGSPLPARFQATLQKYRVRAADNVNELSPHPADTIQLDIPDAIGYAANNPDAATALVALSGAVASYAAALKLL